MLGANFDQQRLEYEARWDPRHEWMDIGFRAGAPHEVSLPRLDLDIALEEGEQLRVEVSTKFRRERIEPELREAGLRVQSWWTDALADFAVAMVSP